MLLPPPPPPLPLEEPELGEHVSRVAALPLAHAGRDPLHLPLYVGTALAAEVHPDHAGLVGHAAAPVRAHATVGGPELLGAGAARQVQLLRLLGLKFRSAGLPLWDLVRAKEVQQVLANTEKHLTKEPMKLSLIVNVEKFVVGWFSESYTFVVWPNVVETTHPN